MFRKILIANRGEIVVRIIRTCKKLKVKTVGVYSEADVTSLHASMVDEAYSLGAPSPIESYLNISKIIQIARKAKVDAVHPGYGFLAENPNFARQCEEENITFIGPRAKILGKIANKFEARKDAVNAGVNPIPGSRNELSSYEDAEYEAARIGYPVILKATYGGGGRGMRTVRKKSEMKRAFETAGSEAKTAFGRSNLYLEKYLENPRHIEVQILAGRKHRIIHLGERECSIQRRHQKILEETPSPALTPKQRRELLRKALKLASSTGYENAGTFEFVMSKNGEFYYLETNKRIQVEHLISEMVTGIDIVEEQLRIASSEGFDLSQRDIDFNGTAINCRINAEDPNNNFAPSPGIVQKFVPPGGPNVRVDTALYDGAIIPEYYDSLIAKTAAWGRHRSEAIMHMQAALDETLILGPKNTISLHVSLMENRNFLKGNFGTQWLDNYLLSWHPSMETSKELVALAFTALKNSVGGLLQPTKQSYQFDNWRSSPSAESLRSSFYVEV